MKMKAEHLVTILGLTKMEDEDSLNHVLTGNSIATVFQTRNDVPRDRNSDDYRHFNATALWAVQLQQILMRNETNENEEKSTTEQKNESNLNVLDTFLERSNAIIVSNNPDVQIELLRLLIDLYKQSEGNNDVREKVKNKISDLYGIICTRFPISVLSEKVIDGIADAQRGLIHLIVQSKIDIPDFKKKFIIASKQAFEAGDYMKKITLLTKGILPGWSIVKDSLLREDVQWLQQNTHKLTLAYKNLPSRWTKILGRSAPLVNALLEQLIRNKFNLFVSGTFMLSWIFFKSKSAEALKYAQEQLKSVLTNKATMEANIERVQREIEQLPSSTYHKSLEQFGQFAEGLFLKPYTGISAESGLAALKKELDIFKENQPDLIQQRNDQQWWDNFHGYMLWGFTAVFFLAVARTGYATYLYLKAPDQPRPPALPDWVGQTDEKLRGRRLF